MKCVFDFYERIRDDMTQSAREFYRGAGEIIAEMYDRERGRKIEQQSLVHFEGIYATLPDIGGNDNPLIHSFIYAAISLGFFIAAQENGISREEAGKINYDIIEYYYHSEEEKGELVHATPESIHKQEIQIQKKSALPSLPENWVTRLIRSSNEQADIVWNNRECAILKLYEKYNAREYVPFMCMIDAITYPMRGLGLTRTQTLVDSDYCDFQVKLGGTTQLEPYVEQLLKKWKKKK